MSTETENETETMSVSVEGEEEILKPTADEEEVMRVDTEFKEETKEPMIDGVAGAKRPLEEPVVPKEEAPMPSPSRPRLNINKSDKAQIGSHRSKDSKENRWRPHVISEDYVNFVGDIMYPKQKFGPYGFDTNSGRFSVERFNSLGYILSPLRRPTTVEKWSPFEVAVFEGSLSLFGKDFWQASKLIKTKSTKDVIEFYYCWKKTDHYKQWKKQYTVDDRDVLQAKAE